MSAYAKMHQRMAWWSYVSTKLYYLSLLELINLQEWDSDVLFLTPIPGILASHGDPVVPFTFLGGLSRDVSPVPYVSANFYHLFHEVTAIGTMLEFNGLNGYIGYLVHVPSLAIVTIIDVEQHWGTFANFHAVGKNNSENHIIEASKFLTSDADMEVTLMSIYGRITKYGVQVEGLANPQFTLLVAALREGSTNVEQVMTKWKESSIIVVTAHATLRLHNQVLLLDAEAVVQILNYAGYKLMSRDMDARGNDSHVSHLRTYVEGEPMTTAASQLKELHRGKSVLQTDRSERPMEVMSTRSALSAAAKYTNSHHRL